MADERRGRKAEAAESLDVVEFAKEKLGFSPDEKQILALRGGPRMIVNCTRQWGKSTVAAAKAVHRAYTAPGSLVLVAAPCARQSGELVLKAKDFVRKLGLRVKTDGGNDMSIAFPNGSRIIGLPGNEATTRGFSNVKMLIIDEASRVLEELYRAMRPTLAVGGGDLWLVSTPCGKRGFFWKEWAQGGKVWQRISVPATECARIDPGFLEEERATSNDAWFKQEYMCEFGEMEGRLFSQESIDAAFRDFRPLKL